MCGGMTPWKGRSAWKSRAAGGRPGGVARFHSVDVRASVDIESPDGSIRISIGDAQIPAFTEPVWGFPQGTWYSAGYGIQMQVRRFVPGESFAAEYVTRRFERGSSRVRVTASRSRPGDARPPGSYTPYPYSAGWVSTMESAGEVWFACGGASGTWQGYWFVRTRLTRAFETRLWNVQHIYGYVAAPERCDEAASVLEHAVRTFSVSPGWQQMQQSLSIETSRIVSETSREISRIISDTYWHRQRAMDRRRHRHHHR